jgi:hypothetical protein
VRAWAATAGGDMETGPLGAPPSPVAAAVSGPVLTLDWRQPEARQQAAGLIAAAVAADHGSSSGDADAVHRLSQPVLLKGAAAHWPAVQRWSLAHLAAARLHGRARLAPSLQFPFTEPQLAALLARERGAGIRQVGNVCCSTAAGCEMQRARASLPLSPTRPPRAA